MATQRISTIDEGFGEKGGVYPDTVTVGKSRGGGVTVDVESLAAAGIAETVVTVVIQTHVSTILVHRTGASQVVRGGVVIRGGMRGRPKLLS